MQIEVQCSKNYFKNILPQEAGAFGNKIEKEPQKSHPELKKHAYCIFTENICPTWSSMQVAVFCKNVLILYNNDSRFLTLKVA